VCVCVCVFVFVCVCVCVCMCVCVQHIYATYLCHMSNRLFVLTQHNLYLCKKNMHLHVHIMSFEEDVKRDLYLSKETCKRDTLRKIRQLRPSFVCIYIHIYIYVFIYI